MWDSDPLSVGATPLQQWIDGVQQFENPTNLSKPLTPPLLSTISNRNNEISEITTGVQDLHNEEPTELSASETLVLKGVTQILLPGHEQTLSSSQTNDENVVVIQNAKIICIGPCTSHLTSNTNLTTLSLSQGHLTPTLTSFGSLLGLEEIAGEPATSDGSNSHSSFSAAIDGLSFDGKNLHAAFAHGVTRAITAPKFGGADHKGIGVAFRTGAKHALEKGAVIEEAVGLHYTLSKQEGTPSLSSAVDELRGKLFKALRSGSTKQQEEVSNDDANDDEQTLEARSWAKVVQGEMPLIVGVHSADLIASLVRLKSEVDRAMLKRAQSSTESRTEGQAKSLRLIILGGAEAHLLAPELASANIGVILSPLFSYAATWDQRRALTGAPLTNGTAVDALYFAGVKVAIGVDEDWEARDLFLQAGIVRTNSMGKINDTEALGMVSSKIWEMVGLEGHEEGSLNEFVVHEGDPLGIESRVRVVVDGMGGVKVWS